MAQYLGHDLDKPDEQEQEWTVHLTPKVSGPSSKPPSSASEASPPDSPPKKPAP